MIQRWKTLSNTMKNEVAPWAFGLGLYCYLLSKFNLVVGDGSLC